MTFNFRVVEALMTSRHAGNWAAFRPQCALAGNARLAGCRRRVLCTLVLVAAAGPGISRRLALAMAPWHWIAAVPSVLGFAVALRCIWDFGRTGHGTPAPFAPPQKLVVVGFYRYVRNPMYVGFFAGWLGLWMVFRRANAAVINRICCCGGSSSICKALRRTNPAENVWRGL